MKYLTSIYENLINDNSVSVAIYNASEKDITKKLIAIVSNLKLASRYIYGDAVNSKVTDKIKRKMEPGKLIKVGNSVHNFDIAVRNTNTKQKDELGDKKWIFFNGYKSPWPDYDKT